MEINLRCFSARSHWGKWMGELGGEQVVKFLRRSVSDVRTIPTSGWLWLKGLWVDIDARCLEVYPLFFFFFSLNQPMRVRRSDIIATPAQEAEERDPHNLAFFKMRRVVYQAQVKRHKGNISREKKKS